MPGKSYDLIHSYFLPPRPLFWTRKSFQHEPKEMETSLRGELPDAVAERKHPGSDSFAFRFVQSYGFQVLSFEGLRSHRITSGPDHLHKCSFMSFYLSLCTTQRLSPFKSHVTSCSVPAGRYNIQPLNSRISSYNYPGFVDWIAQNEQILSMKMLRRSWLPPVTSSDHSGPRICCR